MQGPGLRRVLLLLSGDSALAERRANFPPAVSGLARAVIPGALFFGSPPRRVRAGEEDPRRFPSDQVICAERVVEAAERLSIEVEIVDINTRGLDREVVDRYVGRNDVLPVLVRADGQRLVGAESFGPAAVRDFLFGA
jgi:hypothetical protein